jgi:sortase (surface protein transpeptidase)
LDSNDLNLSIDITTLENRIIIPKIWKNIPLLDVKNRSISGQNELNNIFMEELENGVVRYPWSAKPWEKWLSFIFWHSSNFPWVKWDYNDVFATLDRVMIWDEVIIYYWQKKYVFKINERAIIKPWDVGILKRNENKVEIAIMTCRPLWTTLNRFVIVGELVS